MNESPSRQRGRLKAATWGCGFMVLLVMDASRPEQAAVRAYIEALPDPFPMQIAGDRVTVSSGRPVAFCHVDNTATDAGRVWVLWATADSGDAGVEIPCLREQAKLVRVDGSQTLVPRTNDHVRIHLQGDKKMASPVLLIDCGAATK